jgi:hypothetical protein
MPINRWMKKRFVIHTMEYHSATGKNEVLIHAIKWMDLDNIMPSKRSQTQRPAIARLHLYEISKEQDGWLSGAKTRGGQKVIANKCEISFRYKNVLQLYNNGDCTHLCEYATNH